MNFEKLFNEKFIKNLGLFVGGALFGTIGLKLLTSKDAKNIYVKTLATGLRVKDCVMTTTTKVQETAEDILAEAQEINAKREREDFEQENDGLLDSENNKLEDENC